MTSCRRLWILPMAATAATYVVAYVILSVGGTYVVESVPAKGFQERWHPRWSQRQGPFLSCFHTYQPTTVGRMFLPLVKVDQAWLHRSHQIIVDCVSME